MSSLSPFLSVIIPAHDEEAVILPLLHDLQHQANSAHETIVVAHKCTDTTPELAHQAGARTLVLQSGNVSDARNLGARHAQGKVLMFIDADARINNTSFLATLAEKFVATTQPLVATGPLASQTNHLGAHLICSIKNMVVGSGLLKTTNGYLAVPKNIWQATGGFTPAAAPFELITFTRDAHRAGAHFIYLSTTTTLYSVRRYTQNGYLRTLLWWFWAALSRSLLGEQPVYIPASEMVRKNPALPPKKLDSP